MLNVSGGGARLLEGLASTGRNPITYALQDVEMRVAEIVSLPELAKVLGLTLREPTTS